MKHFLFLITFYFMNCTAYNQVQHGSAHHTVKQKLLEYVESPRFQELSSAGKSTLISEILNILDSTEGDISITNSQNGSTGTLGKDKMVLPNQIEHRLSSKSFGLENESISEAANVSYPANCMEILTSGNKESGVYTIRPTLSEKPIPVLCDMKTQGGGWTHIQKRVDGRTNFERSWSDYKFGFGDVDQDGEFWIGLKNIYALTGVDATELLVEITDRDGLRAYAHYKNFAIGREQEAYPLKVLSGYSGDAGESLSPHLGMPFSTFDFDHTNNKCATLYRSGWWYIECFSANPNGKLLNVDLPTTYKYNGIHWRDFKNLEYGHARARMLVRPVQF